MVTTSPARRMLWVFVLLLGPASCARPSVEPTLNILLVTLDTTRADALGCYSEGIAKTPRLDALAASGARFEHAITTAPYTGPAHASLLTGLYPQQHGLREYLSQSMSTEVPTLPAILSDAGYSTAGFLSSFVLDRRFGLARGFDHYSCDFWREVTDSDNPQLVPGERSYERDGREAVDEALLWMRDAQRPFLAWVHLFDAHAPYTPPADFRSVPADVAGDDEEAQRRLYYDEVSYTDFLVGRLLDWLVDAGIDERTIVVVAGDHGEMLGLHGRAISTHSTHLVDEALRVPLIVRLPGVPPVIVTDQASLVDVLPTLLEFLGLDVPRETAGRSLLPLIRGEEDAARAAYSETLYEHFPTLAASGEELVSLRANRWKLVRRDGVLELYDLQTDPDELRDVAGEQPDVTARLGRSLDTLIDALAAGAAPEVALDLPEAEQEAHLEGLRDLGYVQ